MEHHVFLAFVKAIAIIATFTLWISQKRFHMFVNFDGQLHNKKWVSYHIDIVILEFHETSKVAMIVQPKTSVVRFDLCHNSLRKR